jgi:phage terminase Nu1 subunit (DNA packaging protein)
MSDNDATVTTAERARLFGTTPKTIADLGKSGIIVSAGKRGRWRLQPSVSGYVKHLRAEAAGRGNEARADARARLSAAQADLAEAKAERLGGEVVPVVEGRAGVDGGLSRDQGAGAGSRRPGANQRTGANRK